MNDDDTYAEENPSVQTANLADCGCQEAQIQQDFAC